MMKALHRRSPQAQQKPRASLQQSPVESSPQSDRMSSPGGGRQMGIFTRFKRTRAQVKTATMTAIILGPHVEEFFSLPRLAGYTEEWKNKIKADFNARTLAVVQAENPFLALRKEIGDCALWYADYQALAMTAGHKAASFLLRLPLC
jgi:hypothetical protein